MNLSSIQTLECFAEWLAPDPNDIEFGSNFAEKMRKLLAKEFSFDRFCVAGSKGKGTALRFPLDFDCVLFLNLEKPQLNKFKVAKRIFFAVRSINIKIIIF